jgi:hypothetical protein
MDHATTPMELVLLTSKERMGKGLLLPLTLFLANRREFHLLQPPNQRAVTKNHLKGHNLLPFMLHLFLQSM